MTEENRTLLIVDDELETLKGYQEFLSPVPANHPRTTSRSIAKNPAPSNFSPAESYTLLTASSGEEALEIVRAHMKNGLRVAAGFFDVKLEGGMDGLAALQAIQLLDPEIHCAVVTAYQDRSVDEINTLLGERFRDQWDYLNKPFTRGEIVQKARQMVSAWNRKRQIEAMGLQLVRSERLAAIGQVSRGIGHEFGNILLRIIGKADLSLLSKDVAKIHDNLNALISAAERASVIVRNLQSFSKTEPHFQHEVLSRPFDEAASLVGHELVKSSLTLVKNYGYPPTLRLDAGAMAQVALNLFLNAAHAMPKGGQITVTITSPVERDHRLGARVTVADTGVGIAPEILPKIFEYAFTTKGDQGSGLGLSISKEIIEAHGGTIEVQSEIGKGTEFHLWLPLNKKNESNR